MNATGYFVELRIVHRERDRLVEVRMHRGDRVENLREVELGRRVAVLPRRQALVVVAAGPGRVDQAGQRELAVVPRVMRGGVGTERGHEALRERARSRPGRPRDTRAASAVDRATGGGTASPVLTGTLPRFRRDESFGADLSGHERSHAAKHSAPVQADTRDRRTSGRAASTPDYCTTIVPVMNE